MADTSEILFFAELLLQLFQASLKKLYYLSASQAYKMVVMFVSKGMLIMSVFINPFYLFYKPAFKKKLKRSVNGSP